MPWRGNWPDSSGRLGEDNRHINRSTPILRAFAAGTGTRADEGEPSAQLGDQSPRRTRVLRTRQLPTDHCHAVRTETRAYQHDHRRDPLAPSRRKRRCENKERKNRPRKLHLIGQPISAVGPPALLWAAVNFNLVNRRSGSASLDNPFHILTAKPGFGPKDLHQVNRQSKTYY